MARVAHISDVHFGKSFDFDVWRRVRSEIEVFAPSVIIVSGDFVDSPDPLLLLAAKCELLDLAAASGPTTQFFVMPGNHDLLDFGNIWHPGSSAWFRRVMFSDTSAIRTRLEAGLNFRLGLNEQTMRWATFPRLSRMKPSNWIWADNCDGRLQSCDFRRRGKRWPTRTVHDQVLVVCLDSNSSAIREFVFATGRVGKDQVERIDSTPPLADCPSCGPRAVADAGSAILFRIAVLHHHPLPIAVRSKSGDEQVAEARLEPFLILKNGGDLIQELQRQKFDLILHGHKHRPQFARIQLRADAPQGYPLLVLAGGSAAKRDEAPSDNTLRNIETESSGRLRITTFEEGIPKQDRIYSEPLADLKRRASTRTMERTSISAKELYNEFVIDAVGHLRSIDRTIDLQMHKRGERLDGMVSNATLAPHDTRLDVELDDVDRDRVELCWRDDAKQRYRLSDPHLPADGYYWLHFREPLTTASRPLSFGVHEAAANSITMSTWELSERTRHAGQPITTDEDHEQVGVSVNFPADLLTLKLTFPNELGGIKPEVRCRRHPASPNFPLRYKPDERPRPGAPKYVLDPDLTKEESEQLRYDFDQKSWILKIDNPIAGNIYALRWRVPDAKVDGAILRRTTTFQEMLATITDARLAQVKQQCQTLFDSLARRLMGRFRSADSASDRQTAFLMVYHSNDLCLRPILTCSAPGPLPPASYEVPLGGGVAGAAFLQRRILAWTSDPASRSLIKPVSSGALDSKWVLALPIFHQSRTPSGQAMLDVKPGAVIGVVTLGSDQSTSRIAECSGEDDIARQVGQEAQEFAQVCVYQILEVIRTAGGTVQSP